MPWFQLFERLCDVGNGLLDGQSFDGGESDADSSTDDGLSRRDLGPEAVNNTAAICWRHHFPGVNLQRGAELTEKLAVVINDVVMNIG
jgi:hypothetical protein